MERKREGGHNIGRKKMKEERGEETEEVIWKGRKGGMKERKRGTDTVLKYNRVRGMRGRRYKREKKAQER